MNPKPPLTGSHRRTFRTIFQNPTAHDLEWRAVYSLLEKLGQVTDEPDGSLKATRNGHEMIMNPPRVNVVAGADEILALRQFLEQSEPAQLGTNEVETRINEPTRPNLEKSST
jgi:hypothetical protein